jgi:exopolysaccharide production protein ExoZ
MGRSERLVGIQVLRGVAAMLVVLGHFCLTTQEYGAQGVAASVQYLAQIGQTGVDIFFCISGFVMMVVATREGVVKLDPIEFVARRLIRIVPVYWLVTCALLLLVLAANIPKFGFAKTVSLPVLNPTFLIESLVLWPTRNPANGVNMPFLAQGWTLS